MDYDSGAIEQDYVESGHNYSPGPTGNDSWPGSIMDNDFMDYDTDAEDQGSEETGSIHQTGSNNYYSTSSTSLSTAKTGRTQSEELIDAYCRNNPITFFDPDGMAEVGDVVFFNWGQSKVYPYPHHAAIVTRVDNQGNATHAFGGWGDTMTFHEVDLSVYGGGIKDNIIGYGRMKGITTKNLANFLANWPGTAVAQDWNGHLGMVCIDVITDCTGWGGQNIRDAMKSDYIARPKSYKKIRGDNDLPDPNQRSFYRKNPWLKQYFENTKKYEQKVK